MSPEEEATLRDLLVLAIKELGEIAECVVKEDTPPDHWKNELGDLCGLAVLPMLALAGTDFYTACCVGAGRKREKLLDR